MNVFDMIKYFLTILLFTKYFLCIFITVESMAKKTAA